jgi:para-aminobenzoate synthetase / 4-amino-4-deoxychorismate lyase
LSAAFELLETMRWTRGEGWYLLGRHLARIQASARHFRFRCPVDDIRHELTRVSDSAAGPLRVRLRLSQDGTFHVEHTPLENRDGTWRVRLAERPIDPADEFLYHKTTNRDVYNRARRTDCDDVVLWNPAGEITETTIANIVVELDGRRVTPPVACGLLPGTMRAELLDTGEIVERAVSIAQLKTAARFWLVNSVRGRVVGEFVNW